MVLKMFFSFRQIGELYMKLLLGVRVKGYCFDIKKIVFLALEEEIALKSRFGSAF